MNIEKVSSIWVTAILCLGAFFWGSSVTVTKKGEWHPVQGESVAGFRIVAFHNGAPSVNDILRVPEGAGFYFEPDLEERLISQLEGSSDVRVNILNRSSSARAHDVVLELFEEGSLYRYYYRADRQLVTPLGWAKLSPQSFLVAGKMGLAWVLVVLLLWCPCLFWVNRVRESHSREDSQSSLA